MFLLLLFAMLLLRWAGKLRFEIREICGTIIGKFGNYFISFISSIHKYNDDRRQRMGVKEQLAGAQHCLVQCCKKKGEEDSSGSSSGGSEEKSCVEWEIIIRMISSNEEDNDDADAPFPIFFPSSYSSSIRFVLRLKKYLSQREERRGEITWKRL